MSYTSTKRGGLVSVFVIGCAICGATSQPQPWPEFAWAAARGAGWEVPPESNRGPHCPACRDSFLAA